ncbi:tudor domain-containing 6 [Salminus brasiliensis]|uniref:tudor domain-containing 6 n=1 Tax=Salminus brasiliensis TaxID=930266 RepID=UPI003B835E39
MCSIPGLPSPGSNVTVLITRVNLNPLCVLVEFWGNFDQDRRLAYQRMKKEIQYPRQVFHEAEGSPGDLCLVRVYETWYRARIVSRNATNYSVFLIDEGRTLRATTSTLAWGQTDFFYLPPEVEFCVLANVLPLSPENRWSKMALEFMKTFCGRRVTACVQDVIVPQRTFLLDIPGLSKQMYEMGFAKKLSNERFRDFVTRSLQSHSEPVEPQIAMTNEPYDLVEQTEKQHCYMYPELQTETVETVIVTEVTNPLRVFCQLKVFSQELRKLTEHITEHYEGKVGTPFSRHENLGAPCASRGSDGKWYRSVLQQVMSSSNVAEVLLVDYGKKQFVKVEHVRPLASEFFRMPVVTYVCSLHGIIDRGVGWTASQIDFLKSLVLNRTVIAKFEYQSLSEGVHYVTLYGDENTNINSLFGLREKCLMDSKSHEDYAIPKSTSSQKCRIPVGSETEGTGLTTSEDPKGNTPVFFTESLSPNTSHIAAVQHVDSPAKFWIHTQKYADEFDQLMQGLEDLCSDPNKSQGLIRKPVPGRLCVAKSQDGMFYRAAVCKITDEKAEVFFLDYGNTELVDCFNLYEIPLRYQKLPALAIRCALYGIQPSCEQWDEESTLFFSKAVQDKVLDVHVLAKSHYTHVVQVIDSSSDGEQDVSKLMCSAGLANCEGLKKVGEKLVAERCVQKGQTYDMLKTSIVSPASSSPAIAENKTVFKEYLFPIGSSVEVTVSYIESPNDFWCQKANNAERLKLLMQDLQDYYATSEFQPPLEAACVARHPENGMWYRALAIQKHQTPHVTVLFVDYGQTKKVAIHDLRRINPAFLKLNGQAFRCSLYNLIHPVPHSSLDWTHDATLQFKEFVDNATSMNVALKCTVYAVMNDTQKVVFNVVDLETPFQSVCNLLVQKGLADHASKKAPLPPFRLDTYYYSTHGVKTGSEEDVSITSVRSVSHFFCHLERNSVQIEDLANKVNKLCSQLENIDCPKNFGKVCFAKYSDGLWYRGQITSTKPSIVVNFVDYGNMQEVEKSELLPVPFEAGGIISVPVQAIECGLSDMPGNVSREVNNWFENFVTDRPLKALVVAKEPNGKIIVELYDGQNQVNAMIKEKFHIELERSEQITVGVTSKDRNSQNVPVCIMTPNLRGLKRGKEPQNAPERWRSEKNNGSKADESPMQSQDGQMRSSLTRRESSHVSPRKSHHESAKVSSASVKPSGLKLADLPLKGVKPGLEAEVFISHCNSPSSFYVQLLSDESGVCSLIEKLNDQSKWKSINSGDLLEGDLISAVFPDDDSWYRAVVKKTPISDMVDVEFIDFGNTAEVSVSKTCALDRLLVTYPRYSIHCSLAGVMNVDRKVVSDFKKEIEENADKITCTFIKQLGSVWEVKLEVAGKLLGSALSSAPTDALKSPVTEHRLSSASPGIFYKNPDVLNGLTVVGYASFICGPHLFWCQYAEAEKLQEISDAVQKAGNALEAESLTNESLPVGSGCIALYAEDQLWYRAKVTSKEQDAISILFVDYGNESKVKVSETRPLPCEVSDLPPQAFACQLDGFDLSEGSWDEQAADQFFELVTEQLLKVTVLKLGSWCNLGAPHFVRLECGELVINDAMKNCWTLNCKSTALELTGFDSSVVTEIESPECEAETTEITKEPPQSAEGYPFSDPYISTPEVQYTEVEFECSMRGQTEQAGSVVMLDKSNGNLDIMSSQDDYSVLKNATAVVAAKGLLTKEKSDVETLPDVGNLGNYEMTIARDSDNIYVQPDLPLIHESTDSKKSFETDSLILKHIDETSSPKGQFTDKKVYKCSSVDSSMLEHEENRIEDNEEIIKSDLGYLKRASEKNLVGSQCAVWSHAHKNWCQAQILKISEDSTLVLLLDHDSEMVVDPVNIFKILPEKPLQAPCGGDTDMPEEAEETSEGENIAFGRLDPLSKAEETENEAVASFACTVPSDHVQLVEETSEIPVTDLAVLPEEQPQDKDFTSLGDLVKTTKEPMYEDLNNGSDEGPDIPPELGDMSEDISAENKEPVLSLDPGVDLGQNMNSDLMAQAQDDSVEVGPQAPVEEQRDDSVSEGEQELMDFLAVTQVEKAQDAELEAEHDLEALIEEVNSFTEDLIDFASDAEQGSDTAFDDMLQGDTADTEPLPAVTESAGLEVKTVSDSPESEELSIFEVSHLTLKVQDVSDDDIIFVKAWQVPRTEANEPGSGE